MTTLARRDNVYERFMEGIPQATKEILDKAAALLDAWFSRDLDPCSTILLQCAERRYCLLSEIVSPDGDVPEATRMSYSIISHHGMPTERINHSRPTDSWQ